MESAGARNIRVSVEGAADPVQPKNNKGQTLLPWRMKTSAGLQLRTLLIRHVLSENLHLKEGKSGIAKLWDQLVDQLMKEPEFCQHITLSTAPLSGRNLRDHYERIVNEQCEFHGWDRHGGVTGNLSGGEGEVLALVGVKLVNERPDPFRSWQSEFGHQHQFVISLDAQFGKCRATNRVDCWIVHIGQ